VTFLNWYDILAAGCSGNNSEHRPTTFSKEQKSMSNARRSHTGSIEPLGALTPDKEFVGDYRSQPTAVPFFEVVIPFKLERLDDEPDEAEFRGAVQSFLRLGADAREQVEAYIFQYYEDIWGGPPLFDSPMEKTPLFDSPVQVWGFVSPPKSIYGTRRIGGDQAVYISFACECEWEREHGLQVVFRHGRQLCYVGPVKGHLTNADARDDPSLENTIYLPRRRR
jgi:hypothetical protein